MIKQGQVLGLILARGGSKGIPRKNIKKLNGKPLVSYTIKAARKSSYLDRIVVSTDDSEIAAVAEHWGAEAPFLRPDKLATDEAASIDAVIHAVNWLKKESSYHPEYTMLLQPTSPLRKTEDIDKAVEKLIKNGGGSLIGLSESDKHPYWMMKIKEGEVVPFSEKKSQYTRRQDLPEVYEINGAIYLAETEKMLSEKKLLPGITLPYTMPKKRSIDIDDRLDWKLAEVLLKEEEKNDSDR
jgi:CMP-N-acetylneuraminic acid synthetase